MQSPFVDGKILQHCDHIGRWQARSWYPPIQVEIDLTNRCSSACPWCAGFLHREESTAELSIDLVTRILGELADIGVKSVVFTGGGDPTMHREWIEAIRTASAYGLRIGLVTNGVIDVREVVACCEWIRFSVDAATEDMYALQHGRREHFARVLKHVKAAALVKDGCTIGVGFVTSRMTQHEIRPFAELWRDVPVDYIQFRPLLDTHGVSWFDDDDATIREIEAAQQIDGRVTSSLPKYQQLGGEKQTARCYGAMFETAIAADGHCYVCCHHKGNPAWSIGDLRQESFQAIWERHIAMKSVATKATCPALCRHFATNRLFELTIDKHVTHPDFI